MDAVQLLVPERGLPLGRESCDLPGHSFDGRFQSGVLRPVEGVFDCVTLLHYPAYVLRDGSLLDGLRCELGNCKVGRLLGHFLNRLNCGVYFSS